MENFFCDRVVLVTGASGGIGQALIYELAKKGAKIALNGTKISVLQGVAREAERLGARQVIVVPADLGKEEDCVELHQTVVRELGHPEILFLAAGVLHRNFAEDITWEDLQHTFLVNTMNVMFLTGVALPAMMENGFGRIVVVSSEAGLVGVPAYATYCASKWALHGWAEALWIELQRYRQVRLTLACPTYVQTSMLDAERAWGPTQKGLEKAVISPEKAAAALLRAAEEGPCIAVVDSRFNKFLLWLGRVAPALRKLVLTQMFRDVLEFHDRKVER